MSRVLVSTAGVGDYVEVALVRLCHNEVINNPTFLISEEGQRALGGEARKRKGNEGNRKQDTVDIVFMLSFSSLSLSCSHWISHTQNI